MLHLRPLPGSPGFAGDSEAIRTRLLSDAEALTAGGVHGLMIENMGDVLGRESLLPLWWSLALGACLGGNGSLIGASANLIVAGFAERSGQPIRFLPFMLIAFPGEKVCCVLK